MSLAPGSRLGAYEVVSLLGAGGMGEVYKARDTRLDRTVAIKVMPPDLAADPQFRARFDREARAISQLQHPHICTLYDVGEVDGTAFLVMELLQGQTLADRLKKGALPLDEALRIAIDVADALSAAHKQGIVHRDLKPANIMLTKSGAKLLDFGLAEAAARVVSIGVDSRQETLAPELTHVGGIVGTLEYMAPEQVEQRAVTAQTDLFALAATAYEMLTGSRAFGGSTPVSVISAILTKEPAPTSTLVPTVPRAVERLITACLIKDPDERWQSAHDLACELRWVLASPELLKNETGFYETVSGLRSNRISAPIALSIVGQPDMLTPGAARISPDGQMVAFEATDRHRVRKIWLRRLSDLVGVSLAGTEDAAPVFWSPDSRTLAFFARNQLKTVMVPSGVPQTLCGARPGAHGSWGSGGDILFDSGGQGPIYLIAASGGSAVPVLAPDSAIGKIVRFPEFLPDGVHFLFISWDVGPIGKCWVGNLRTGERRVVAEAESRVIYAPFGYLLSSSKATLVAQRFDAATATPIGRPKRQTEKVRYGNSLWASVSDNATLVYQFSRTRTELQCLDRSGRLLESLSLPFSDRVIDNPALSRDGKRLAVDVRDPDTGHREIWIKDLNRGVESRLLFGQSSHLAAVWSPDGRRLAFTRFDRGKSELCIRAATGSEERCLIHADAFLVATDFSPDGSRLLFYEALPDGCCALRYVGVDGAEPTVETLVSGPFRAGDGHFSPDGRFIVFSSNESGRMQVYVQSLSDAVERWQVSASEGDSPEWSRPDEITYFCQGKGLMRVHVVSDDPLALSAPELLFRWATAITGETRNPYTVHRSDDRFVVVTRTDTWQESGAATVVLNWAPDVD